MQRVAEGLVLSDRYQFGEFEFTTAPYALEREGVVVRCTPQSLRLLELFLAHAGETVTRRTIRETLWPEDVHLGFDRAITVAVRELRQVLGDRAAAPRFIETLPRVGYRWVAGSQRLDANRPARRATGVQWLSVAAAILVVVVAAVLGSGGHTRASAPAADRLPIPSGGEVTALVDLGSRLLDSPALVDRSRGLMLLSEAAQRLPSDGGETALRIAEQAYSMRWSSFPKAGVMSILEPAAQAALRDERTAPRAHLMLGDIAFRYQYRWPEARRHYQAAMAKGAGTQAVHHYGLFLLAVGEFEDALAQMKRAESEGWPATADLAYGHFVAGDLMAAKKNARRFLETISGQEESAPQLNFFQASMAVEILGEEALKAVAPMVSYYGRTPPRSVPEWEEFLSGVYDTSLSVRTNWRSDRALWLHRAGRSEAAIAQLLAASMDREGWSLPYLEVDPRFEPLRAIEGFEAVRQCLRAPLGSDHGVLARHASPDLALQYSTGKLPIWVAGENLR